MLELADRWIWDSWYVRDGDTHHAFFLTARRDLPHPDDRHLNVSVGHATSTDLRSWTVLPTALSPSATPAFDDLATWTGSVLRHDDLWWMFYTGASRATKGLVQTVGIATSPDLTTWTRVPQSPVSQADPQWYELLDREVWHDQAWRDPWVLHHDGEFHMLVTARVPDGPTRQRGVIGHCTSPDLMTWTAGPPLTLPGAGFGQMEVPQVAVVDGVPVLLFCCGTEELDPAGPHERGGMFSVAGDGLLGPFDASAARRFPHESLYAARLVEHEGSWWLLGFRGTEDGRFVGALTDPIQVTARPGEGVVPR
ncbi:glycosyl hydrolase family 32 [Oryzobacter telluris]|uniref:glycosyl hydrolase family 32 n=1 Tax=Oryzobacter telluris TaxID=3149179 RepID=UPI00370D9866